MIERTSRNPNQVIIFDTTLRDGNQTPIEGKEGVFTCEDKVDIARVLCKMEVNVIEGGFPNSFPGDFEAVSQIARKVNEPIICALSRTSPEDIDRSWEAIEPAKYNGGARLHIFIATSEIHMRDKLKMTPEQVIAATRQAVTRAKGYTNDIEFSPEDASRSDFNFMMRVILEAVDSGATTVNIPDTVGFAQPIEYAKRIRKAKSIIDHHIGRNRVIISAHCHNDLGLATANTLAAVMAGARQVEVTVNGIGERAGNTALEEVAENIRNRPEFFMYHGRPLFTTGNPGYYLEGSRMVAERSGVVVQPNRAIVGEFAWSVASGIHQQGVIANPKTYHWMDPAAVNREISFVINNQSGSAVIVERASQLGFTIGKKESKELMPRVKNYLSYIARSVADTDLEKVVADFRGETLTDRFVLEEVETHGVDHNSRMKGIISIDGKQHKVEGKGNGPVNAAINAIKEATGLNIDIENYAAGSFEGGSDAKARCFLVVRNNGIKITTYAEDESVDLAPIKAYVAALNTIYRSEQRKEIQSPVDKTVRV